MDPAPAWRLNWGNIVTLGALNLAAIYALWALVRLVLQPPTMGDAAKIVVLFVVLATVTGFGITVGYHRLFTHTGFECSPLLRILLLVFGGMAIEGQADKWVRDHRQHHRKSDVTWHSVVAAGKDPARAGYDPHSPYEYPGLRGLLWAHLGWLFVHHDQPRRPSPDLDNDRWIQLQKKYYPVLIVANFAIPLAVAGWNGLLIAGVLRTVWIQNVTWAINSVTHVYGRRAVDSANRAYTRDNSRNGPRWLAWLTFGEANHANHHARPRWAWHGWYRDDTDPSRALLIWLERRGWVRHVVKPELPVHFAAGESAPAVTPPRVRRPIAA